MPSYRKLAGRWILRQRSGASQRGSSAKSSVIANKLNSLKVPHTMSLDFNRPIYFRGSHGVAF
jgi:hypothetical protein